MLIKQAKIGLAVGFVFLQALSVSAQPDLQKASDNFNKFQRFVQDKNVDSAFQQAQELAGRNVDLLNNLLHNAFAQSFMPSARNDTASAEKLLRKMYMATGNRPLQQSVYPLFRWVETQNSLNDPAKIRRIVTGFLMAQTRSPEEQGNRIDRYALLIYNLLRQKPAYTALADTLFQQTRERLEHAVNGVYYQAVDDRRHRPIRAYFRYLMAYANHVKAEEAAQKKELVGVESFRKAASAFSPDDNDRLAKSAYFYESAFLSDGQQKADFHQPYVDFLLAKGDTTTAVQTLTDLALADPGMINLLKAYYAKLPVSGQSFNIYWTRMLNAKLKPSEPFRVVGLDQQTFDYEQYKGKWVLIDFWGTWCKPCVAELPRFQKFYDEFAQAHQKELVVLTVACNDSEPKVREFMKKHQYTFPVAMADNTIEKSFRVGEYPTKVLITPQGNRMKIPFGVDWAERVKIYMEN